MNAWIERIEINPKVLQGKPVVRGTRIPVSFVLGFLANGMCMEDVIFQYPTLSREEVLACLGYARETIDSEEAVEVGALAGR